MVEWEKFTIPNLSLKIIDFMFQDHEGKIESCYKKAIKAMKRIARFENLINLS